MEHATPDLGGEPTYEQDQIHSSFLDNKSALRLHQGVVLVLFVTLIMTLVSLFVTITLGIFHIGIITTFMLPAIPGALVANSLEILFCIAWLIMLVPLRTDHAQPICYGVRVMLMMSLWVLILAALADYLLIFGELQPIPAGIHLILQVATIIPTLALYPLQLLYINGIARLTGNAKIHQRAMRWIWLTPIVIITPVLLTIFINAQFFWLLIIAVLVVVIQYWNMIEYTRRDLKKIIAARVES